MALPPVLRRPLERARILSPLGIETTVSPSSEAAPESDDAEPLAGLISKSAEGYWLPAAWMDAIADNDDEILARGGGEGLKLFDALLDDDIAFTAMQQRRAAVVNRPYRVEPGDKDDPRSVKAADDFRAMIDAFNFDNATDKLLYTVWFGYGIGEAMFEVREHDGRQIVWLDDIVVPDRRHFGFTNRGELRLTAGLGSTLNGDVLPENKFVAIRTGGTHDFAFYGLGLAHWCYWPIFFKRATLKFWALYLERYGQPTTAIEYPAEEKDDKVALSKRLTAAEGVGKVSAVLVPKGTLTDNMLKVMSPERSGQSADYATFVSAQEDALLRVVLGQSGTAKATPGGLGGDGQASKDEGVKREIVKADSDLVSPAFGRIAKWITQWNHGFDVKPPSVYRVLDDEEDLTSVAERDSKLNNMGWERTDESFRETYGEGYQRKPEPEPVAPGTPGALPDAANDNRQRVARARLAFDVDDEAPLYVWRKLSAASARALAAWAKANGLTQLVPLDDMHVTILYSKTAVDWFDMAGEGWDSARVTIDEGGPRALKRFGGGAVVLRFASPILKYRHESMIARGASSDYPEYKPHVTLSYDVPEDFDLDAIEPFTGELTFGPEIFERIVEKPAEFGAIEFDALEDEAIDRLSRALAHEANPVFVAMFEELRGALQGVTSVEGARVAILDAFEALPVERLARLTALPLLAERAAASIGAEDQVVA